jgi:hypothetical protein
MYQAPNGSVFYAGPKAQTRYLDLNFDASAENPYAGAAWRTSFLAAAYVGVRDYGSSAMYGDGLILNVGGDGGSDEMGAPPTTATAEVIDLNAGAPGWRPTSPMNRPRRQHGATILADGSVLVTGGTECGKGLSITKCKNPTGAVLDAELWDPASASDPVNVTWTTLARMQVTRVYHSAAVLLPDGRVVVAGGGHPGSPDDHPDAEIFSPPYWFKSRPKITSAPRRITYGNAFRVEVAPEDELEAAHLIRPSSVTHGFDQNQRLCPLGTPEANGDGYEITPPSTPNRCPPGTYLFVVLDGERIPSEGRFVTLEVGNAPEASDDSYEVDEDGTLVVVGLEGVLGNDSGDDGLRLTARLESPPAHGRVTLSADGSFAYTPDDDFSGADEFTYQAAYADSGLGDPSEPATVTITVRPVNDPPIAENGVLVVVDRVPTMGTLRGSDIDGDELSFDAESGMQGRVGVTGTTNEYTYRPEPDAAGTDEFTFTVRDGSSSSSARVTVVFTSGASGSAGDGGDGGEGADSGTSGEGGASGEGGGTAGSRGSSKRKVADEGCGCRHVGPSKASFQGRVFPALASLALVLWFYCRRRRVLASTAG